MVGQEKIFQVILWLECRESLFNVFVYSEGVIYEIAAC